MYYAGSKGKECFIDNLQWEIKYLSEKVLVGPGHAHSLNAFKTLALYGSLAPDQTVEILSGKIFRKCKGWLGLKQAVKRSAYKAMSLQPRPSDPDYVELTQAAAEQVWGNGCNE